MDTIKVIGQVDQHHQLVAQAPDTIAPGPVEALIVPQAAGEDDAGENWAAGLAAQWQEDMADPRQDIYSLADGVPVDDPR